MDKAELQEIASLRAVLERILRVMDEGLFVDYQMEKFGQIKYDKDLFIKACSSQEEKSSSVANEPKFYTSNSVFGRGAKSESKSDS